ncbi:acyl-CoA/acyl-ACP dehydrogenase [Frankia sp. CNm7]|uniref:Acyl-CoA/acyl-ACP dehydrogenase n=1 Tax=Frankia nepalensis TaxID=1836974 RepID=A0A937USP9_9ACTN|nr:acyl-CoA dehydrogenase family protein [Frankia nepalensis]MBL7502808.1 acyl-CoA/acyl-ACP dehydrogenase [Frankia nepalensis]MBL7515256.1 acyl-CoA/acyl-ACP dehydrogenase [Frankia nepalensis]MBL7521241.1 acyl-CoA/acyl-ACP dehydrogenase [Frankia nepalensis]MBL7629116.1 acyl-CoA/acyl-ACP dehydrogenase [Frankia nepalensis]
MSSATAGETSPRSFIEALASGRLPWELFAAFPEPGPRETAAGDELLAQFGPFIDAWVDGDELDRTRVWPDGLLKELRDRGYFQLTAPAELGGRGLSPYNLVRVVVRAARRSMGVGQMLCVQNGIAASALLPAVPAGPLRDFLRAEIAAGSVSGFGDTDPAGQNNTLAGTTATLTDDGSAYLLRGEKLFIANAGIADLLGVSATVTEPDGPRAGVFFLTTDTPGFEVVAPNDFIGLGGLSASFRLTDARVPRERAILGDGAARLPRAIALRGLYGRAALAASGSLAVIRNCLEYCAEFLARRRIDGRGLAEYDKVQRIVAGILAAEFAVESAVRWTMVDPGPEDRAFELYVTKNLATVLAWRASDRAVALLGGEGIETAQSKRRRGATAHPVERYHRDARVLRTVGNVDYVNDLRAGQLVLARYQGPGEKGADGGISLPDLTGADLSAANRRHLAAAAGVFQHLHRACRRLTDRRGAPAGPGERQEAVILVGELATELFGICAVLGRAARSGDAAAQDLADVYATAAGFRVADLTRRLAAEQEPDAPDYARISRAWLTAKESL